VIFRTHRINAWRVIFQEEMGGETFHSQITFKEFISDGFYLMAFIREIDLQNLIVKTFHDCFLFSLN